VWSGKCTQAEDVDEHADQLLELQAPRRAEAVAMQWLSGCSSRAARRLRLVMGLRV
jgi:hypothetical protein